VAVDLSAVLSGLGNRPIRDLLGDLQTKAGLVSVVPWGFHWLRTESGSAD
jgi:hypothetical protein